MATGVFALLKTKRFLPYFLTQAFGAFNDNLFKQGILLLFTFVIVSEDSKLMINLSAMLFILPFFLFSPLAGQIADKYEKSRLIRWIKIAEIGLMILGSIAFYYQMQVMLLFILFLMGTQSAMFGPVKYSILPQHLHPTELLAGNALVEMGTFLAILLGTILAGILFKLPHGSSLVAVGVILFASMGYLTSRFVPVAPTVNSELKINFNPFTETLAIFRKVKSNRTILLSIMAISWFWFLGASYLTQFNLFTKDFLYGDPFVATGLLTLFSVGIALGSILCSKMAGGRVELGLVPIGSLGLTIFGMLLYFATPSMSPVPERDMMTFLSDSQNYPVLASLLLIGVFGGFYIVPLYALIQERSEEKVRAQVIALNNIVNAIFMVTSAIAAIIMLSVIKISIPEFFFVLAIMNCVVAIYIYHQVPEFALRFCIWMLSHGMYRVKHTGLDHIPEEGPAVLVCNHVSYVDALLIGGAVRRPVRFVMDKSIAEMKGLAWFFKLARTIPITSQKRDPEAYSAALTAVDEALKDGELVCIFPDLQSTPH